MVVGLLRDWVQQRLEAAGLEVWRQSGQLRCRTGPACDHFIIINLVELQEGVRCGLELVRQHQTGWLEHKYYSKTEYDHELADPGMRAQLLGRIAWFLLEHRRWLRS